MGILSSILGVGGVVEKGIDLIDKKFPSDAQMIEAKTKAKTDLLAGYAPFKIAQRILAIMFASTFIASYLMVLVMYFLDREIGEVLGILQGFKIDYIVLMIVGFYFGGGAFEGVVNATKKKKE